MQALGEAVRQPGRIYFTGGVTALLLGWREVTIDIDLKAEPEPAGFFEALPRLKEQLAVNLEMACPSDFIPELPGWRDRSLFIARYGVLDFYHYDFYSQALAKIERGHARDRHDVQCMLRDGLVEPERLRELFEGIQPALICYPAIAPEVFAASLRAMLRGSI